MRVTGAITAFVLIMLCVGSGVGGSAFAADAPHHPPAAAPDQGTTAPAHAAVENQAVLPPSGIRWPGVMVMIVLGMFLAAIVIGPIVRANLPEEPAADAHGNDHAHGSGDHGGHH